MAKPAAPVVKVASVAETLATPLMWSVSVVPLAWQESVEKAFTAAFPMLTDLRTVSSPLRTLAMRAKLDPPSCREHR